MALKLLAESYEDSDEDEDGHRVPAKKAKVEDDPAATGRLPLPDVFRGACEDQHEDEGRLHQGRVSAHIFSSMSQLSEKKF